MLRAVKSGNRFLKSFLILIFCDIFCCLSASSQETKQSRGHLSGLSIVAPSKTSNVKDVKGLELHDTYGVIIKEWTDSSVVYIDKKRKEFEVALNEICYKDGEVALKDHIYKTTENNYECNIREVFVILFNNNLEIEEVRIADVGNNNEPLNCEHKKSYINAIKKTKGLWMKKGGKHKKYIYIFSMHIH